MQAPRALVAALLLAGATPAAVAARVGIDPLSKVTELLVDLKAQVKKQGGAEDKAFKEYTDWCSGAVLNSDLAIKAATSRKGKLEAQIAKLAAEVEASTMKIEELGAASASSEADLKKATELRKSEASDFTTGEKELMETIDTLGRALQIIEREAGRSPSALMQMSGGSLESVLQSLTAVVNAASFTNADRQKLLALVQDASGSSSDGAELGAPAAPAYQGHSEGIVDVLEDLRDKAESQLSDLRRAEEKAQHSYAMLRQSLLSETGASEKEMADEKSQKAADEEAKASAEGDLAVAIEELKQEKEARDMAAANCKEAAADHEASLKSREEELATLTEAIKALRDVSENAPSLLQLGARRAGASQPGTQAVELVRRLSRHQHSAALAQLASRVASALRYGAQAGADPFAEVKSLIEGMIAKLEAQAGSEATEKAFCDSEMAKTKTQKGELSDDTSKLTVMIEQAVAKSAGLKEEVKDLQSELSVLTKAQAELDRIRQESHADYVDTKASLETGLAGVRKVLRILREYYANKAATQSLLDGPSIGDLMRQYPNMPPTHQKAAGAGSGIIGLLEVVESDMADSLAKEETQEADFQLEYERTTQENKITAASKDKDVTYKGKEIKSLEKTITELASNKDGFDAELAAVTEYYGRLQGRCVAKPASYEERKQRREAEIGGLKEALQALEEEASFVQFRHRGPARRHIRGSSARLR